MKTDYDLLLKQLNSLFNDEDNYITILANTSALLNDALNDINWVGFYLYDKNKDELTLGPFQGKVACMHIPMNKGVCGTSAFKKESLVVKDVHAFDGHIACDSASNSEIVIPIIKDNKLFGVLDIDSPSFNRFDDYDKVNLEEFISDLIKYL